MAESNSQTVALSGDGEDGRAAAARRAASGPSVIDVRKLYGETGLVHLRPGLHLDRELHLEDHLHRRRRRHPAASRLLDRGPGHQKRLPGGRLPDPVRRAADPRAEGQVRPRRDLSHHAARADHVPVPRLPARRPSDGGDDRGGRRAVGLLPRGPRHQRSAQPDDRQLPAGRQGADDRRDGLQVLGRPAVHVSAQRSDLRRELPAHDVRRCRASPTRSTRCSPGRSTASSSCTPITSRTPRPRPCAWSARPAPARTPRSPPASPRCGGRRMAAPTRRWSTC